MKKKALKPGYYWVSDQQTPTEEDWKVARYDGDDRWYVEGEEYSTGPFRHVDRKRLEREPVDRRAISSKDLKSFTDFLFREIVGIPLLSADRFKKLFAEWQGSGK